MFADIDGNTIHYVSEGEGPPVVFVHGLGGTANVWHGVIQAMKQHHHCIAMDLRGHGRSQAKGKFSIQGWARDLHKLVTHLELPAVTVVGHSLGTLVARDFPDLDAQRLFDPAQQMGEAPSDARRFAEAVRARDGEGG